MIKHIYGNFWSNNHLKQLLIKEHFQVIFDQPIFDQNTSNICKRFFYPKKIKSLFDQQHSQPSLINKRFKTIFDQKHNYNMFDRPNRQNNVWATTFETMFDQTNIYSHFWPETHLTFMEIFWSSKNNLNSLLIKTHFKTMFD